MPEFVPDPFANGRAPEKTTATLAQLDPHLRLHAAVSAETAKAAETAEDQAAALEVAKLARAASADAVAGHMRQYHP